MVKEASLFDNYKYCKICKRLLPQDYGFEMCPPCIESELFREVKMYIRENDVTEHDVAEHFDLPLRRVKQWIRDGRIEYKQEDTSRVLAKHCARCGEIVAFGELCTTCKHILTKQEKKIGFFKEDTNKEEGKMRYMDKMEGDK